MKKFRLRQEINMTKEDGTPLKELSVDVWISTEGVDDELIKERWLTILLVLSEILILQRMKSQNLNL